MLVDELVGPFATAKVNSQPIPTDCDDSNDIAMLSTESVYRPPLQTSPSEPYTRKPASIHPLSARISPAHKRSRYISPRSRKEVATTLFMQTPDLGGTAISLDTLEKVFAFSTFKDICRCCLVSTYWNSAVTQEVFLRLAKTRWSCQQPVDLGVGINVPLCLHECWAEKAVYREHIENLILAEDNQADQLAIIEKNAVKYAGNTLHSLECFRWITEVFDGWIERKKDQQCPPCTVHPVSIEFLEMANDIIAEFTDDTKSLQMVGKAVGIMVHNERTRARLPKVDILGKILTCMSRHQGDAEMISCLLWSLVIMCRPVGGIEGEVLSDVEESHFANVHNLKNLGGIDTVLETLEAHESAPGVLSKVFWLTVNLALADDVKEALIGTGIISKILSSMQRFPDNKELQYRACFSLINMGIKAKAKDQIHRFGGVELILAAMRNWPDDVALQKCGVNVIRSILVADTFGIAMTFMRLGGVILLEEIQGRFAAREDLMLLTRQTLFILDNPGQ